MYPALQQEKSRTLRGQWSSSVNVTHILYTGDFPYVDIDETIADLNKKQNEYTSTR